MNKVESALQRTTDTKALVIGVAPMRSQPVSNQVLEGDAKEAPVNTNVYPACPQAAAGYNNNRAADTIKQRNFITIVR